MNIIQFTEANCKNCYKCIRSCPVKAISFQNEQARILDSECVLCGECVLECPQNAKRIHSDIGRVRRMIENDEKVYVSLAPSYPAAFPGANLQSMAGALRALGFSGVEETAIGAAKVSAAYADLMAQKKMRNIITTACPTAVLLVEKHFPDLVDCLAPVVSPMVAHCRLMKEAYGPRIKTVFIGPCLSKKYEPTDPANENAVNAVLTFEELYEWLAQEDVSVGAEDSEARDMKSVVHRLYPLPGGIVRTLRTDKSNAYRTISVDGIERGIKILESLRDPATSGYFVEFNACAGACLDGPAMRRLKTGYLPAKEQVLRSVKYRGTQEVPVTETIDVNYRRRYFDLSTRYAPPAEEDIREVLRKIGKTRPEHMLNCGGCGYPSCRDKAIAVLHGKADLKMCLPYLRELAESTANMIIENTPNAILVLDGELNIESMNPAAAAMLRTAGPPADFIGGPVDAVLPCDAFVKLRRGTLTSERCRVHYPALSLTVEQNVFAIERRRAYVVIMQDVTKQERQYVQINRVREETLEAAQKVIDRQMRVAQEIASLLGETTADTKLVLTRLKRSVADENEVGRA